MWISSEKTFEFQTLCSQRQFKPRPQGINVKLSYACLSCTLVQVLKFVQCLSLLLFGSLFAEKAPLDMLQELKLKKLTFKTKIYFIQCIF